MAEEHSEMTFDEVELLAVRNRFEELARGVFRDEYSKLIEMKVDFRPDIKIPVQDIKISVEKPEAATVNFGAFPEMPAPVVNIENSEAMMALIGETVKAIKDLSAKIDAMNRKVEPAKPTEHSISVKRDDFGRAMEYSLKVIR